MLFGRSSLEVQCSDCFQRYKGPHRCPPSVEFNRVVMDPNFKLFGLDKNDILDLKFYLDCTLKTPQQMKAEALAVGDSTDGK